MKSRDIRDKFLNFFKVRGHQIVSSSSLVPHDDPTLLFTNAGMNQFKDVFLGLDKRNYQRATTSQKCVRAGGKHNDLENVGYTARHHTFFEMLGNFSFGDYFKREAIQYSWELLTTVFGLPEDKLLVTVYQEDDEAFNIWHQEIGLPEDKIIRIGDNKGARYASDNFWMMGDTGPCGPSSEIFYDHGPHIWGGPPGSAQEDGDRFIEIWNIVFMQFNRDEQGVMQRLPRPSVDTGMGLERMSAILQGVHSNYEIDLFQRLIRTAAAETDTQDLENNSLKVLADHIRACAFLIADGVIPGNEGRGYVLRRIIRRAVRHGYKLGARAAFFHLMVPDLVDEMGDAFPELKQTQTQIIETLKQEEVRFFATIEQGMGMLEQALTELSGQALSGALAFKLHDTYGFPLDLTQDICREQQVEVDIAGFDQAMAQQKAQARAAGKFKMAVNLDYSGVETAFHGYQTLEHRGVVQQLYCEGSPVAELTEGQQGTVVLDHTPFYAESGGQVGDQGRLRGLQGWFAVDDTQKIKSDVTGHQGTVTTGKLSVGDAVSAQVDQQARAETERHHSATHLLHYALRQVLGEHVQQKGSYNDAQRLRFDFVHQHPLTADQLQQVEDLVNQEILQNQSTQADVMALEQARDSGALMLFGEKYGDEVRVMSIGASKELCGGTHVKSTGDIGLFSLVSESGVAAGVRRIEAVAGQAALARVRQQQQQLQQLTQVLKTSTPEVVTRAEQLMEQVRQQDKEIQQLKGRLASSQTDDLVQQAVGCGDSFVVASRLDGLDAEGLRESVDKLKARLKSALIVLAAVEGDKVVLIAGVTDDLFARVKAGDLVKMVAQQVGGKGGGRPGMAMAGGNKPEHLASALASVVPWAQEKLK